MEKLLDLQTGSVTTEKVKIVAVTVRISISINFHSSYVKSQMDPFAAHTIGAKVSSLQESVGTKKNQV